MPILFRSTPVNEPFIFESAGNAWEQDRVSRPNGFPFYHYLQTEKGAGTVRVREQSYTLREKEGILIAPFIRHSYEKATDIWTTKFISFTGLLENSIPAILGKHSVIFVSQEAGEKIAGLIDSCITYCSSHSADAKQLSVLCYSMLLCFSDIHLSRPLEVDPLFISYVEPVMKEIELNYALNMTVEELSRKVFITPQYLSRLFRRFLNCSTYEYITSYRISRAKELLIAKPGMDVQDIARCTGFSDASHFIVVFKKLTGMTPLEFRKSN